MTFELVNILTYALTLGEPVIPLTLHSLFTGKIRRVSEILQSSYLTDEDGCSHDEVMRYSPREDQMMTEMLRELKMVCMSNFLVMNKKKYGIYVCVCEYECKCTCVCICV